MPLDPTYSNISGYVTDGDTAAQIATALNADGRHIHNADRLAYRQLLDDANLLRIDKDFVAVSGLIFDAYPGMSAANKAKAANLYNELRTEKTRLASASPTGGQMLTLINTFAGMQEQNLAITLAEYDSRVAELTGGVRWVDVTEQQIQTLIDDHAAFEATLQQWWQRVVTAGAFLVESNTPENPVTRQEVLTALGAVE